MKDAYAQLGLNRGASEAEIKKAYRNLAKELHPDRNRDDPKAAERFHEVTQAYDALTERRGQYDRGEIDEQGNPREAESVVQEELWEPSYSYLKANVWSLDLEGRKARIAALCAEHPHLVQFFAEIDEPPIFARPPPTPPPPPPPPPSPPSPPPPVSNTTFPVGKAIGWVLGIAIVYGVLSELGRSPNGVFNDASRPRSSGYAPATTPSYSVQPFASNIPYTVSGGAGVRRVNLRSGPGSEFRVVLQVPLGYHVIGNGSTVANDGTVWISVTAVGDNHTGFIAERLLQRSAEFPPSNANADPQEVERSDVSPPALKEDRGSQDQGSRSYQEPSQLGQAAPIPDVAPVSCILPSGQEMQLSYKRCRELSGVIYE